MKSLILTVLLFLFCSNTYSQWEWQYPQPTGNDLYDVCFADDLHGWAVGVTGIIIYTSDGGTTWELQQSGTTLTLRSVSFIDSSTGWVVGGEEYPVPGDYIILFTNDGGDHWIIQAEASTSCLRSVYFVDSGNGWAVGTDGTLLRTTNGGTIWTSQWTGSPYIDFNEVLFTDIQNGWMASESGLFKTSNGGTNWSMQVEGQFNSVFFITQNIGWASTWGLGYGPAFVFHTSDAFITWDTIASCGNYDSYCGFYSIFFNDALNGWILENYCSWGWVSACSCSLLKTKDGGATWEYVELSESTTFNNVCFTPNGKGFIMGEHGNIFVTTDWGDLWLPFCHGNISCLSSLSFPDDMNGWAVGVRDYNPSWISNGSIILHTPDGGATWYEQNSGIQEILNSVCFADTNTGWAVGTGYILNTQNGGADWIIQHVDSACVYNDVFFTDEKNGWAVGYDYVDQNNQGRIMRTQDSGASWGHQDCGTCNELNAVYFIDKENGWVVGMEGEMYHTTDGGLNWMQQSGMTDYPLQSVFFTDQQNGWIVGGYYGSDGVMFHTTDGGNSWQRELSDTSFYSVYFRDHDNGLISGDHGLILKTTDGGVTWKTQSTKTDNALFAVCLTEDGDAYAAGQWGTILHSPSMAVTVEKPIVQRPDEILSIMPNPVRQISEIKYSISDCRFVSLVIFNNHGQKIKTLVNEERVAGEHTVHFDATGLPPGIYLIHLQFGDQSRTVKMIKI
jgi:photosystem II stability/assembly factor-like uncharacterized protein